MIMGDTNNLTERRRYGVFDWLCGFGVAKDFPQAKGTYPRLAS
jgi:hypothetical protein